MADLFEGAPESWLRSSGDDGIDLNLFDWIYRKATTNRPPQWLQSAGEAAYQGMDRMFGSPAMPNTRMQQPEMSPREFYARQQGQQKPYMNLRASIMRGDNNGS